MVPSLFVLVYQKELQHRTEALLVESPSVDVWPSALVCITEVQSNLY